MSGDSEDKKFFPTITVKYSPTIFGIYMPIIPIGLKSAPQPL